MGKINDDEIFFNYIPDLQVWYKLIKLYLIQFIIFILIMSFFWWISSYFLIGAIVGQMVISIALVLYFIYLANNSENIRKNNRKKYGKLAGQHFWFKYLAYINPIVSASFYFPLLLKTNYFLPAIITFHSHLFTNSIFTYYIAIPLGIFFVILGLLIRKSSGDYSFDTDAYLYMIYPENGKLITNGMYKFIRNPQYLSRGIIAIGFGFIANNFLGIIVGIIHFISYLAIIPAEDKELLRRVGYEFKSYKKRVPSFFPKYGNWKKFIKLIFIKEN
jgi:protein-S-isoprenylcysteine O-methyltransferase Ste14